MEKVSSEFLFKTKYQDISDKTQGAKVVLVINYKDKTYNITPYCGTVHGGFMFVKSSHKWKMWKALT